MSTDQEGDPVTLQFVRDEDRLVLSSPHGVLINVLKISNDLLPALADALPKDASVISDLISDHPLPLVNCVKGIVVEDVAEQPSDFFKRPSETSLSIFGAEAQDFGLYLIQHRSGSVVTTIQFGDSDSGNVKELVTATFESEDINLLEEDLQSKELVTSVVTNDEVIRLMSCNFTANLKSHISLLSPKH